MTRLMEQAIERLRKVPETEQDRLAQFLLNELKEDELWSRSTADHETRLKSLINNVLTDDNQGACEPLDPDRL
jgi:hypothetical protein